MTTFGTTGYTFNNVFLLYDRMSRTVWYPLEDGAFDGIGGPLHGKQIPFIDKPPLMTLGAWRSRHPDTQVLLGDRTDADAPANQSPPESAVMPASEGTQNRPFG